MKKTVIAFIVRLFILTIIIHSEAYSQWNTIYTTTVTSNSYPYQVNYTRDSAIFITTKKDFIYSKNNGISFIGTNSFVTTPTVSTYNTYREFTDISFANKDTGSIVGFSNLSSGFPFAQSSTGTFSSWILNHTIIPTSALTKINSVKHFKNQKVYAFDNNTNIYYSANSGATWILKNTINNSAPIFGFGMSMVDEENGYFATQQGIFKTIDGGQTTTFVPGFPMAYLYNIIKIRFRDISNGYIIAANNLGENKLFKTNNGGNTWQDVFQGKLPDPLVDVSFPTDDTGFVATSSYILQTFNSGTEWYIQRFTNTGFNELEFIDNTNGVAVAQTSTSSLKVMKYIPNSISNNPFAVFNFQTNYCCNGQVCNIINYGSPSWTYKWYVNNILSSTAFTPTGLILPNVGNNNIKLVAYNGANKDSVTLSIYNAGTFSGTSNFNITPYDTTICYGSQASLLIGNYSSQLSYSAFSNTVQISPWITQISGNLILNTTPLNFNDTMVTVMAVSGYSNCPGNSFSKTKKIKILPLPPSNLMTLTSDSICYNDSAGVILSPLTAKTSYTINWASVNVQTYSTSVNGVSYTYKRPMITSSNFYYISLDSNGCKMTGSAPLLVRVDSIWTKLKTSYPYLLSGDTITLYNQSVATNYLWTYSPGSTLISNNDSVVKLTFSSPGDYYLSLHAKNDTGCRDSLSYYIGVCSPVNSGSGQLTCFYDSTLIDQYINSNTRGAWFIQTHNYNRFHTDIRGNYYLAENKYLYGYDANYGALHFKLAKYDQSGVLKWVVTPGFGIPGSNYVHTTIGSVSSDIKGNIYITGNFKGGKLTIGSANLTFTSSLANAFIAKIDSNGNCKWILGLNKYTGSGGTALPASAGKVIAEGNRIYFKADFTEKAICTDTVVNIGSNYSCLMIVDSLGNYIGVKAIYDHDIGQGSISSIDGSGASPSQYFNYEDKLLKYRDKLIHYGFTTKPSVHVFNGPNLSSPVLSGYTNSCLLSYIIITDTLGNFMNAYVPAAFYDSLATNSVNYSRSVRYQPIVNIDKNGFLYFTWNPGVEFTVNYYEPSTNYNYTHGYYNKAHYMVRLNDNSQIKRTDPFSITVKYNLNGNVIWHKEADYIYTKSIVINNDGNLYGLGNYYRLAAFGSATGNRQLLTTTDTCRKMLMYSYDDMGNFKWSKPFTSVSDMCQYPGEIVIKDTCNTNLYFTAGFDTTTSFMNTIYSTPHKMSIFKFTPNGSCSEINCIPTATVANNTKTYSTESYNLLQVAPNPNKGQFNIHSNSKEELFIQVYNTTGQLIKEINLQPDKPDVTLDIINSGMYYIIAKGKYLNTGQKVLVVH